MHCYYESCFWEYRNRTHDGLLLDVKMAQVKVLETSCVGKKWNQSETELKGLCFSCEMWVYTGWLIRSYDQLRGYFPPLILIKKNSIYRNPILNVLFLYS